MLPLRHTTRSRRSGVTLVEIVIAMFILTIGVLSIFSLFPTGYQLTRTAFDSSVSALAARDAKVRIRAELLKSTTLKFPASTVFASVPEVERTGTVTAVTNASTIQCRTSTDEVPTTWGTTALNSCYIVFTSGAVRSKLFLITASTNGSITCNSDSTVKAFRLHDSNDGSPVSVGDHFAIIGSNNSTDFSAFPRAGTKAMVGGSEKTYSLFTGAGSYRTMPVANQGAATDATEWLYRYGVIISKSSPEMQGMHRIDIFVYRAFDDSATLDNQDKPVGHFTTYVSGLDTVQ